MQKTAWLSGQKRGEILQAVSDDVENGQADQREHSAAVSLHAACGSYEHSDNRTGLLSGAFSGGDCLSAVSSAAREKQPNDRKMTERSLRDVKAKKPGLLVILKTF